MKIEDIDEISDFFNTSVSIGDTENLINSYYSEQQQEAITSSIVESVIESFAPIEVSMVEKSDVEGEGVQPPPENKTKLKSSDKYDYTEDVIPGKFSDDWEYILHGEDGDFLTRW